MDCLTYNFQYKIPPPEEAFLIHCAYLLADHTLITGTSRQQYHHFDNPDETFQIKMKMLEALTLSLDHLQDLRQGLQLLKGLKKIKHPNAKQIVHIRQLEKMLLDIYKNESEIVLRTIDSFKFIQFDQLAQYGFLSWYNLNMSYMLMPEEKNVWIKDIMKLLPGENNNRPLSFILPSTIFKDNSFFDQPITSSFPVSEQVEGLSFLHPCFEMPNLLPLSLSELHNIKINTLYIAELFHTKTNEWIAYCKENNDPQASLAFFNTEVVPAIVSFRKELEQNKVLFKPALSSVDEKCITLFMGEISFAAVWQLYYDAKCIPDEEEWKELCACKDDPAFARPYPVLIMHLHTAKENANPEPILKKSINID